MKTRLFFDRCARVLWLTLLVNVAGVKAMPFHRKVENIAGKYSNKRRLTEMRKKRHRGSSQAPS